MMKNLIISQNPEENLSNLTSATGFVSPHQNPVVTKRRNLPGNPDPDAEVIALSPNSLMAINRFMCEICNKGFKRDQNLQLHRRGHNLPWKLKQRTNSEEVRKKVYVCPELTCVHHDPSRALGDLTGIKKHFSRKHGEKKWKCVKCSKRYAVQSDLKAHSKICGTREYKCDCGTLFSRRDSFITHRAFCDTLAAETARSITQNPFLSSQPFTSKSHLNLQPEFNSHEFQSFSLKRKQQHYTPIPEIPPWLSCPSIDQEFSLTQVPIFHGNPNPNPNPNSTLPPYQPSPSSYMSATALLQKAAQMGSTMTKPSSSDIIRPHTSTCEERESGFVHGMTSFGDKASNTARTEGHSLYQDMMGSFPSANGFDSSSFKETIGEMVNSKKEGNDCLTRDFLGLRAFSHGDILKIAALDHHCSTNSTLCEHHSQTQKPWNG